MVKRIERYQFGVKDTFEKILVASSFHETHYLFTTKLKNTDWPKSGIFIVKNGEGDRFDPCVEPFLGVRVRSLRGTKFLSSATVSRFSAN